VEVFVDEEMTAVADTAALAVAPSPIHGLGVFSRRPFEPGDVIEVCPVVVCPVPDETHLEQTAMRGLYFHWTDDAVGVALGYGSLYNHSWTPNARYEPDFDVDVIRFVAVRPVAAGEELTVNYTGEPEGTGALWFEPDE
jgi:SET domain-containing protein